MCGGVKERELNDSWFHFSVGLLDEMGKKKVSSNRHNIISEEYHTTHMKNTIHTLHTQHKSHT